MVKKFITDGLASLPPDAQAECRRLWEMRDTLTSINDVTFPILCQYCGVWAKVNEISNSLMTLHGEQLEDAVNNLQKLQKIMFGYATVLKLNEKTAKKSNNKFFDLLVK